LLRDDARLVAYAAPAGESVRRVKENVIARVRGAAHEELSAAAERAFPRARRLRSALPRVRRIAAFAGAAAAVVIALLMIDFLRGAYHGPIPAFAAVQEKMQKYDNVTFRIRSWSRGEWTTREVGQASAGIYRRDYGDSITIKGFGGESGHELVETCLYPARHRATVSRTEFPPGPKPIRNGGKYIPHDPVNFLASWYKTKGFNFVRTERLNGRNAAVYEKLSPSMPRETRRMTAWVDLETELPVRLEIVAPRSGPNDNVYPIGLQLSDFTADSSSSAGWVFPKPDEPIMAYDNFNWNAAPADYFSFTPPDGYGLETYRATFDSCLTEGESQARYFVVRLSRWLAESGNIFPDDLADLDDHAKVKQLLIAKYRRGGVPAEEFRAAYDAACRMEEGSPFLMMRCWTVNPPEAEKNVAAHYVGKGAAAGDSRRVVCWLKDENAPPCPGKAGNGPYFSIYADLHMEASSTPPKLIGR